MTRYVGWDLEEARASGRAVAGNQANAPSVDKLSNDEQIKHNDVTTSTFTPINSTPIGSGMTSITLQPSQPANHVDVLKPTRARKPRQRPSNSARKCGREKVLQSCQLILGSIEGENSESGLGLEPAIGVPPKVSRKRAIAVKSDIKRKKGRAGEKDIGAGLPRTKSGVETLPNSYDPDEHSIELKSPTESSLEPCKQIASLPIELSAKTLSKLEAFRHKSESLGSERRPWETFDINLEVSKVPPPDLLLVTCCRNLNRVDTICSEFHGDLDDDAFINDLDEQGRTANDDVPSQIVISQDKGLTSPGEEEYWRQPTDNEDFAVQGVATNFSICSGAVPCRPFIRPAFPALVQNPPFIKSLTNQRYLRICFRIGEAIREGSAGARASKDAILELYARVRTSSRSADGWTQHFQFGDLYHDHQPYLDGVYKSCHEKGSLWERDSAQFLGEAGKGKMARVVGRLKWEQAAYQMKEGWRLTILNIWEANWDDLEYVRGIVDA